MNLGKRILSLQGNGYMKLLRSGQPEQAIYQMSKDYESMIDNIIDDMSIRELEGTKLKSLVKYSLYDVSNYGNEVEYYDYDNDYEFAEDYRSALKAFGMYLPEEVDVLDFIFEGRDITPEEGFPETIMDEGYGELKLIRGAEEAVSDADICADMSLVLYDSNDLITFFEVCYDTFVDMYAHLSKEDEIEAINYAPYTLLTDYVTTVLFSISHELRSDIIKLYTYRYEEFKQFDVFESALTFEYPDSILECVQKDDVGMLFMYNYRDLQEESMALTCICMMFKNYLERRLII